MGNISCLQPLVVFESGQNTLTGIYIYRWRISMRFLSMLTGLIISGILLLSCSANEQSGQELAVELKNDKDKQAVEVYVDGKLFTAYLYTDQIAALKKTTLYPIKTARGNDITRGFPLEKRAGERVDHPHHIGMWLNYGDVDGLDFWNNSDAIPEERRDQMGVIRHDQIKKTESGQGSGTLVATMNWLRPDGTVLLKEGATFHFYAQKNLRIIDRFSTLTALDKPVSFKDNKEGMFAIRVTRALEHPSDEPIVLSDAYGKKTDVPVMDNSGVTGHYLSSTGVEGMDVWGTRAKWVALNGEVNGEKVSVVIFDHPDNVGYPTYWHARGYGLFSANPLGQAVFSDGKEVLNFALEPEKSVTFKYRTVIFSGETSKEKIEKAYAEFLKEIK